ncbi:MAG: ABC transporter substrate-binding protein, partial [Actinomycetes bacterium]
WERRSVVGSTKLLRGAVALILGLGLIGSACSSDKDDSGGAATSANDSGGEVVDLGTFAAGEPDNIDPALTTELEAAQVTTALFDGLTEFAYPTGSEKGELKGLVAESWEPNADATEWTFKIRDGLKFSNGDPVLPSSFKVAWDRAANPLLAAGYGYLFGVVKGKAEWDKAAENKDTSVTGLSGVTADDANLTLKVQLAYPYADFPSVVSHIIFSPVPEKVVAKVDDQSKWDRALMVGNGPFELAAPRNDREIVITPNRNWKGDVVGTKKVSLDKVTFKISKDVDTAFNAFQANEGQTSSIPSGKFDLVAPGGEYAETNTVTPQLGSSHFIFGMQDGSPVAGAKNLKLRQAISLAINRDQINRAVYNGSRLNSTGITPPGIPGFEKGLCDYCTTDMAKAKKLLSEWKAEGGSLPGPLTIQFNEGAGHEDLVAIIQANLKELGVDAQQDGRSDETYYDEISSGGCVLCRAGWAWDYPIYDNGMFDLFSKASIGPGSNNLGQYSSDEFSSLVDDARRDPDDASRQAKFRQAEDIVLNQDTAVVPLVWDQGDYLYSSKLVNFHQEPLGWVRWEQVGLKK